MSGPDTLRRRRFLQLAATAAASGAAITCANRRGSRRYLSGEEAATLDAIGNRLIPADQDPGAAQAGLVNFIDCQLMGPYRRYRKTYRHGLIAVDHVSSARFGKPFVELAPAEADEILTGLERGEVPPAVWDPAQAKAFFELLLAHTMQAYYGDPRHGGNEGAVSWRMLGVPAVPLRGRLPYDLAKPADLYRAKEI